MFGKCSNLVPSQRWAADRRCTDRPASFPRGARAIVRTEHQAHAFRRHEGNCSAKWPLLQIAVVLVPHASPSHCLSFNGDCCRFPDATLTAAVIRSPRRRSVEGQDPDIYR
ncbi:MAG: DUF3648 domain-containing protein [Mesorhizobium sp.]|nr:MAG: DUF3648 domain-containing protein [Mesorhizobium sp.]TIL25493.1 MAG: DUF3648 domain-containing protein [Mesorhizobium sp.]TIL48334.1 MAG: DUF3648 domain-containing protein [Mesorhizobium sp.]TIN32785.1 MAG: DUF3648 domain-containing protein [Mesorhizobium sp.]